MVLGSTQKRRIRARAGGFNTARNGSSGPHGGKTDWRIVQDPLGWLSIERPAEGRRASATTPAERCPVDAGQELITEHADWVGPVKLMNGRDGPVQRIDVFLGKPRHERFDPLLHTGAEEDFDRVLSQVVEQAHELFEQNRTALENWKPPDTKRLAAWLSEAGHTVGMDNDENLRMTIRASGRDGQVRVLCRPGQLRLVLPLGTWPQLRPTAEAAMLRLADQANNRLRLARIAWRTTKDSRSCEAQVDLTGLPSPDASNDLDNGVIRDMVRLAPDALQLALRQLQQELGILADPQHHDLAELVSSTECD
jgi:hypothetical protein